jgi:hypothetical protein
VAEECKDQILISCRSALSTAYSTLPGWRRGSEHEHDYDRDRPPEYHLFVPEQDLAKMKNRECQDNGGSHDEVADGEIGNRGLCPERHAGEIEQQGRHAGQFKPAADGKKDVEEADKHHRDADEHHRDIQVAIIGAVVRGG